MPDNPFENKAKQKLDELKFTPSDAVWQKVEARIKKDKDRRRLLIWLPLFCLLLGMGGWYLVSHPDLKKGSSGAAADRKNENNAVVRSVPLRKERVVQPQSENAGIDLKEKVKSGNRFNRELPADKKQQENDLAKKEKYIAGIPVQQRNNIPETASADAIASNTNNTANIENSRSNIDSANAAPPEKTNAVVLKNPADSASLRQENGKSLADKNKDSGKKNKITWGVTAGAGFSAVSTKFIRKDLISAYQSAVGPVTPAALPADRQSVSGFAGLQFQKPLNKTTSVFAGIQYAYSAIKITRGSQVNLPSPLNGVNYSYSSITSYYAPSASGDFNHTSHYHFLEIPLGVEKQLGKKSRFSVNTGLSFAWLFATNALQFDPLSKIYFKDDSYFNRVQWNVLGGIEYSLLRNEKYTLKIGPQVQYGLTSLLNNKPSYSAHLFSGQVRLLLIRNRK
jgi:hypothetical protein